MTKGQSKLFRRGGVKARAVVVVLDVFLWLARCRPTLVNTTEATDGHLSE